MRHLNHPRLILMAELLCFVLFLYGVRKYWHREHGLTTTIRFGSRFEARSLDALKQVPHVVLPDSFGYDGQFYAQLALNPTLTDPQLPQAIDNLAYRSRRILFSWVAFLLGLGRPDWIIHVYAFLNVLCWFGTALLLWHWLPPTSWFNFCRWTAVLFSSGWLTSVSSALLDGPALLVLLLSAWLVERGFALCGTALLGLSTLGKETNLLAGLGFLPRWHADGSSIRRFLACGVLLVLPLAVWMALIHWRFGLETAMGVRNIAPPFVGLAGKYSELRSAIERDGWFPYHWLGVCCFASTLVQIGHVLLCWKPASRWWRIGLPFALLGLCLGMAVLEGFPGAYTRALLPLTAAFNLSLAMPATWKAWTLLVLGNLSVLQGLQEMKVRLPFRLFDLV